MIRRKAPASLTCVMITLGMLFMLFWNPIVRHVDTWNSGVDLWGIFRAAHYVGWGYLGGIYDPSTGFIATPGLPILLAPLAMLSGSLHLSESFAPYFVQHPTAQLLLEPADLILASTVLFAADAVAEHLGVVKRNRYLLSVLVGVLAWPAAAVWGHGEDLLAVTFALYALLALLNGRHARCGWLLGLGIVTQPLVALLLPLTVASVPSGQRVGTVVRALVLSLCLVTVAFAGNPSGTFRAVVTQPTPPSVNHATPWVYLAPHVPSGSAQPPRGASPVPGRGQAVPYPVRGPVDPDLVSGGVGRVIDVFGALALGLYVWRRPQPAERLLWLAAALLASRCFFEAVMTPYYLAPPLILALVLVGRRGVKRLAAAGVVALEITVFAYHHLDPWLWWVTVVLGLAAVLGLGFPAAPAEPSPDVKKAARTRLVQVGRDDPVAWISDADQRRPERRPAAPAPA